MKSNSKLINKCQIGCKNKLKQLFFFGYIPAVNDLKKITKGAAKVESYPLELFYCENCKLGQINCIVDREILFPKSYPYTSSTTKILRENFSELSKEIKSFYVLKKNDLIVDIGSNDGNLLSNFKKQCRVLGVTPENVGKIAIKKGIPTLLNYFDKKIANKIVSKYGKAKIVTATNVFAHIDKLNNLMKDIKKVLVKDGIFISESHYFIKILKTLQYDTVYHEHMRYYSLTTLNKLFKLYGLRIFHAKEIDTHGGSIRVYASFSKKFKRTNNVKKILNKEAYELNNKKLEVFKKKIINTKIENLKILSEIVKKGKTIVAVGAPTRGSTLVSYFGLDENMIQAVLEVKNSKKIGNYMPGTKIPVIEESNIKKFKPDYLYLLSWHIKDQLIKIFKKNGFKGKFIVPLPLPKILD